MTQSQAKSEIPLGLAILIFIPVVAWLIFPNSVKTIYNMNWSELENFVEAHTIFLGLVVTSISLNVISIYSVVNRVFGFTKQGSRLEVITGKKQVTAKVSPLFVAVSLVVSGVGCLGLLGPVKNYMQPL